MTEDSLIPSNPCKGVDLPKDDENFEDDDLQTWNKDQVNKFLKTAKKEAKYFILHYLALNTEMRQGELLGLKWEDIDLKNNLLKVKRQYCRDKKLIKVKSKSGRRTIPPSEETVNILKKHKIKQVKKTCFRKSIQ